MQLKGISPIRTFVVFVNRNLKLYVNIVKNMLNVIADAIFLRVCQYQQFNEQANNTSLSIESVSLIDFALKSNIEKIKVPFKDPIFGYNLIERKKYCRYITEFESLETYRLFSYRQRGTPYKTLE